MRISRSAQWRILIILNVCIVAVALFSPVYLQYTLKTPLVEMGECSSLVLFGLYCPLCGATHAMDLLFRLDILGSLRMNVMVIPTILMIFVYDGLVIRGLVRGGDRKPLIRWWMIAIYVVIFTLYTILRNVTLLWSYDPTGFIVNAENEITGYQRLCAMYPYWIVELSRFLGFAS